MTNNSDKKFAIVARGAPRGEEDYYTYEQWVASIAQLQATASRVGATDFDTAAVWANWNRKKAQGLGRT